MINNQMRQFENKAMRQLGLRKPAFNFGSIPVSDFRICQSVSFDKGFISRSNFQIFKFSNFQIS